MTTRQKRRVTLLILLAAIVAAAAWIWSNITTAGTGEKDMSKGQSHRLWGQP
jgi:hypothetical protein